MNKIVEEQLNKCNVANLSNYDEATHTYHIPKIVDLKLEINSCYIIKLNDLLLNKEESSVLMNNWNKGTLPPTKYMKVDINKIMGKMIYVTGLGYDYDKKENINLIWFGWLPIQNIEVLERI